MLRNSATGLTAIERVIKHINGQLKNTTDKNLEGVLDKVKIYLENSNNGKIMHEVAQALCHLENVFLKRTKVGLFASNSHPTGKLIAELKKQKKYRPISKWSQEKINEVGTIEVPATFHQLLGGIYVTLAEAYQPGWTCEYITNSPEEGIVFKVIEDWQKEVIPLNRTKNHALRDMGRGGINVKLTAELEKQIELEEKTTNKSGSIDEIAFHGRRVSLFVKSATAYKDEEDQRLIEEWLRTNGSQENQNIVPYLIEKGEIKFNNSQHFKEDDAADALHIGPTSNTGEWVEEGGYACFKCMTKVHSLTKGGGQKVIYRDSEQPGPDQIVEKEHHELTSFKRSDEMKELPPLLEGEVKIKLVVAKDEEGKKFVKPIVPQLAVKSHTDYLEIPARFQHCEQQLTPKFGS